MHIETSVLSRFKTTIPVAFTPARPFPETPKRQNKIKSIRKSEVDHKLIWEFPYQNGRFELE